MESKGGCVTNRKAVFLDVDGTLINSNGRVPDSARQAIREARANGHLVFLSTGRSIAQLWPEIVDIGFDGFVTSAGAFVEVDGQVLLHHWLSEVQVRHVAHYFTEHDVDFFLEANDGIYAEPGVRTHLHQLVSDSITDQDPAAEIAGGFFGFVDAIKVDADPFAARITKVVYFDAAVSLDEIGLEFAGTFDVVPVSTSILGANSGEMMLSGVHKAAGIEVLIDHLGIDRCDTIAIGDGYNDLEMLTQASVGIAMGDAPDAVREVADEVTAGVDADGVQLALIRHGIVGASSGSGQH